MKREWICGSKILKIDYYEDVLQNESKMKKIAQDFDTRSGGALNGYIRAINGWLVCIHCPTRREVKTKGSTWVRRDFLL